jgi:hypothetical protein
MKIEYDPLLIESVVVDEIARRREAGDATLFRDYHVAADPLYHRSPEAREAAFRRLHLALFARLGYAPIVEAELARSPRIQARASKALVALAATPHEEGSDLSPDEAGNGSEAGARIGIRLRPERFADPHGLQRYLRHELLHVDDLLDPGFGYRGDRCLGGASPALERMVRSRYRLLWCLSLDARLEAIGAEPLTGRQTHREAFEAEYRKFPPRVRGAIFERLWRPEPRTHRWLLELATDSGALLRLVGGLQDPNAESVGHGLIPGSPCALCRFPTYEFAEARDLADRGLARAIQQDFPDWTPNDGLCQRCLEVYALKVGRW